MQICLLGDSVSCAAHCRLSFLKCCGIFKFHIGERELLILLLKNGRLIICPSTVWEHYVEVKVKCSRECGQHCLPYPAVLVH